MQDIVQFVLKQKWKWAGHVARLDDNRWTQRVTEWQPREGRRSRGRQRKRWRDNLVQLKGVTWRHDAQHRQRWRSDVEGYFQQWRNQSCGNLSPLLQSPPPPKEKKKKKTKNKKQGSTLKPEFRLMPALGYYGIPLTNSKQIAALDINTSTHLTTWAINVVTSSMVRTLFSCMSLRKLQPFLAMVVESSK